MKTSVKGAIVLVVVGVAAAAAAVALSAPGRAVTTLRLVEKDTSFHFVDNPPLGGENKPSQGDQFVFTSELLTRAGRHAGMLRATCTVTSGGRHEVVTCFGTLGLEGGQLAAMTTIVGETRADRIAIVGGTGIYSGVRGEVISIGRGEDSLFSDDTIRLLRS